jgi:hypothetical protein
MEVDMDAEIFSVESVTYSILFIISIVELYNSFLILFFNQQIVLLIFRIVFFIYAKSPIKKEKKQRRLAHAMVVYKRRIKIYAMFELIGGLFFVVYLGLEIITQLFGFAN